MNTEKCRIKILCYDARRILAFSLQKLLYACVCVYSHSMGLFELADLLNLIHEISSVYVLHDKIQTVLWGDRGAESQREVSKMFTKAGERLQRTGTIVRLKY